MNKILLIAYNYPPQPIVGAVRPSKFVRYLPEFGWEPTVLSVKRKDLRRANVAQAKGGNFYVREWPHPLKSYQRLKEARAKRKGRAEELAAKIATPHSLAMSSRGRQSHFDIKQSVLAFMRLPDTELGWLIPAVWCGFRLIREKQITHLLTTGPPFTSHLVGLLLKKWTGIRWVADFRDPWSLSRKYQLNRNRATDFIEARMIRSVMEQSDLVISTTPTMTDFVKKEYPDLDPVKFVTLTNGFDPDDFINLAVKPRSSNCTVFSYMGAFKNGRTPEPFLAALRSLIVEGAIKPAEVSVTFTGYVFVAEGKSVPDMVRKFGLEQIVKVESFVPRPEALQRSIDSDVLLVLDEQTPTQIPLKLFDALAAGPIIFNIGSGGETEKVLIKTGRGIVANYTNEAELRKGILDCISRSRSLERPGEPWLDPKIQAFNFQKLTRELAGLLDGPKTLTLG